MRRASNRVSLARAQKIGIRTSRVSNWSRSHSFNYAVRATVVLIALIIGNAFFSFTIILSQIDFHHTPPGQNSSSTHASPSAVADPRQYDYDTICSSRQEHSKWRDGLDRHFSSSVEGIPSFAVVLTVNDGYYDFFLNWRNHFHERVANKKDKPLLIIIAEDAVIYKNLKKGPNNNNDHTIVIPGHDFTKDFTSDKAEDYESHAYKSLVSGRATHLLNLMCSLGEEGPKNNWKGQMVIVYSDVDTVWLKDPFPTLQAELFGANNNITQTMQQHPKYDILAAVDDHDYYSVDTVYCTGFLVIAQTPASFALLSQWEKELQSNPQLNQPIFNTLLRSSELPQIRHKGLGEMEFPPGRLYFDEWVKESGDSKKPKKHFDKWLKKVGESERLKKGGESEKLKKKETIVVHNNYVVGHDAKKKRFQEHGLWMRQDVRK